MNWKTLALAGTATFALMMGGTALAQTAAPAKAAAATKGAAAVEKGHAAVEKGAAMTDKGAAMTAKGTAAADKGTAATEKAATEKSAAPSENSATTSASTSEKSEAAPAMKKHHRHHKKAAASNSQEKQTTADLNKKELENSTNASGTEQHGTMAPAPADKGNSAAPATTQPESMDNNNGATTPDATKGEDKTDDSTHNPMP